MSGHNRKKGKGLDWEQDVPSLLGNRVDRSLSKVPDLSRSSSSSHRLSGSTRKTLLGIKNIKDPFSDETQKAIKGFHDYIMTASADDINLEECSLLLSSSAKLFGMQIKTATKHMEELAAFVTNTAKEPTPEAEEDGDKCDTGNIPKRRKRKEKIDEVSQDNNGPIPPQEDPSSSSLNPNNLDEAKKVENSSLLELGNTAEVSVVPNSSDISVDNNTDANLSPAIALSTITDEQGDAGGNNISGSAGDPSLIVEKEGNREAAMDTTVESSVGELDSAVQMGDSMEIADIAPNSANSTCDINKSNSPSTDMDSKNTEVTLNEELSGSQPPVSDPLQVDGSDSALATPIPVDTTATIISPHQLRKRQTKEKPEGIPPKKRKVNEVLPPQLTSIFDLDLDRESAEESDEDDSGFECPPPLLYPEVDLWNGQFDLSADPDAPEVVTELEITKSTVSIVGELGSLKIMSEETQVLAAAETADSPSITSEVEPNGTSSNQPSADTLSTDSQATAGAVADENIAATAISTAESGAVSAVDGATTVNGVSDDTISSNDINNSGTIFNGTDPTVTAVVDLNVLTGASNDPTKVNILPVLAAEDQQDIQNCINQLHYLPFTCELTKEELARTFHSTVGHLETIFKKNNMPFNRQLLKAASVVCANMVSSFSSRPSDDEHAPCEATFNSFREIFSQGTNGLHSDTIASLVNSEKTILERTREKSVAESRATIQKRLGEMQRMIVPKYIQWPLIAENTPEFFHRVKQFEQKMKRVLADEEKKESFDVSKYEIEVLAATAMESQEEELMDLDESDDTNASSAMLPPAFTNGGFEEPLSPRLHHRVLSPISTSDSPSSSDGGRRWVPLSNVFNHMKKFDRNECARHFYAVLALLSSQNLDMNYDRHFSEESAALVTQTLDHTQDSKYPRGLKIMTSRCPDADKEEIYVTALASKSCNETFRDLISHEMNLHDDLQPQSPMHSPRSNSRRRNERFLSNGDFHSESEQDEEFVSMNCSTTFAGNLFGGRKKKQN